MAIDDEFEKHAESIGEYVERFFGSKKFIWETPRTKEYVNSEKCRFKRKIQT
jgi:hypothetical protein